MDTEFFDQRDLSRRWRISARTLEKWRTNRTGPRFVKVGGCVRYRRADVEAWEERRARVEDARSKTMQKSRRGPTDVGLE